MENELYCLDISRKSGIPPKVREGFRNRYAVSFGEALQEAQRLTEYYNLRGSQAVQPRRLEF